MFACSSAITRKATTELTATSPENCFGFRRPFHSVMIIPISMLCLTPGVLNKITFLGLNLKTDHFNKGHYQNCDWIHLISFAFICSFIICISHSQSSQSTSTYKASTKWMVMGIVNLKLVQTKPCYILTYLLSPLCYVTPFCSETYRKDSKRLNDVQSRFHPSSQVLI